MDVVVDLAAPTVDVTADTGPDVIVVDIGSQGPMGPPGTPIVAVPYAAWPPSSPQTGTLYLRLAP